MKKRYAGLAVVVLLLGAFGVGRAQIAFYGVVDPNTFDVQVQTAVVFVSPDIDSYPTAGWGGTSQDTWHIADIAGWPDSVELISSIGPMPNVSMFPSPVANTWYDFTSGGIRKPRALFYSGVVNVAEPRTATGHSQRLQVSPSVVTAQMAIRLQPAGTGSPVVEMHDAVGNVVRSLDCAVGADGVATATWNREDDFGRVVPEGVYFCRYASSGLVAVRKVLVTH
ncbi:hypothetical protein FJY68_02565 [candidate division WOR-3 bacterium]|uniref:FlgD Ig-like domain-containing protein n=1 Tax=candidate division WOR-3 bacterium TaxID=2052148 RepID=A0A938BSI5_UNCW3|nr:hypothetical protein [candidate division WOR-3 bacterium]